ncbi:hypothetical protein BBI11_09470 [Planococcus maritimus]|uniref:hypothetical protein n=1 Tax=Planococcus maritimus TaxID=192421 RepID=UPI00080EF89B|nr:hypothetical protein [Planococcus maritimus]ANU17232.1 hypothetical protein BBI11_09470 [Planococcus maritimus]
MSYVPIFHLTVPAVWVAVLLAAAVANLLMRVAVKQKMGDWYWNALAFYILVWKLSYIVFHWQHFLDMPLSLLYFNGGLYGHLLATAFVIGYLLLAQRKQTAVAEQAAAAWLLFFLAYQSILQFLEAQWVQAAFQTMLFIVAIVSIRMLRTRQDVPNGLLFGALFTVELLILSTFGPLWTWQNATLAAVVAVTIAMYRRFEQKGPSI